MHCQFEIFLVGRYEDPVQVKGDGNYTPTLKEFDEFLGIAQ